jgi:ribosomal protein S18 acetylase RimI-like enzyme
MTSFLCRPMVPDCHDLTQVAALIWASAPELFSLIFGKDGIPVLAALVGRSHNRFSHQYVWVAEQAGTEHARTIVGVVVLVPTERIHDQEDFRAVLNPWQSLRRTLAKSLILRHVLQEDYLPNALYVGNLAVDARYRSQGIGTQLLQCCFDQARQRQVSKLFISVDIENPRAQALYESLGFRPVLTKTHRFLGRTIGSTVLEKQI